MGRDNGTARAYQLYAPEGSASSLSRTIEDNVALPLLIKGEKKKAAREKVRPFFEEFGLEGTQKKYPHQLSGGMRQRAALLRTICSPGTWLYWMNRSAH